MIWYILLGLVGGFVLIFAILAIMAPKETQLTRSVVINLSQQELYEKLRSLRFSLEWSPWADRDPDQEYSFSGEDGTVGSMYAWKGNKQVGEGEQEVIQLTPHSRIDTELRFIKPFQSISSSWLELEPLGEQQTKVTWGFHTYNKIPMSIFLIFINMEKSLGGDFEKGLAKLKEKLG